MFDFFKKNRISGMLFSQFNNDFKFAKSLSAYLDYYNQVAPVGDAVNKISGEASKIDPVLFAPTDKGLISIENHKFLKLLKNPNPYQSGSDFLREIFVYNLVTGNNFICATGFISEGKALSEPSELYNFNPSYITPFINTKDGRPSSYDYRFNGNIETFTRIEVKSALSKSIEIYVNATRDKQLYHFKKISTNYSINNIYGDSPLQDIELEISQYYQASCHNDSLLRNGMSPRSITTFKGANLSDDTRNRVKSALENANSGVDKAGKNMFLPGDFEYKQIGMNLKDADFQGLMKRAAEAIYRKYNIPLPLIFGDRTANANMTESKLNFYDNAILPELGSILDNLFRFIFKQRYKDAGEFTKLYCNESAIEALQPRMSENLNRLKSSGVMTINELREYQGLNRIEDKACDTVYIESNKVPIGLDTNLSDTIGSSQDSKEVKALFEQKLRSQTVIENGKSVPFYSEEEIKKALEC
jgi:hypothetical protein